MSKFQLLCSCIVCKKQLTVQSLKMHAASHTKQSTCIVCNAQFRDISQNRVFCSSSCSATHNNSNRVCRPGPSPGFGEGVKRVCKFSYCEQCSTVIQHKHSKTCSTACKKMQLSQKAKHHSLKTRTNRNPHKQSYMERSFADWIQSQGFILDESVIPEYKVHNFEHNRTYFIDFYFPLLNLAVELDGSQHLKTKEADSVRDRFLSTCGIHVFRISHREYRNKSKIPELLEFFGAATGT